MHDTKVILKDGRKFCGPIWEWWPVEGFFTVCDYDASSSPTRIELKDVASAKTAGQRVSIESTVEGEECDELARARRDGWIEIKLDVEGQSATLRTMPREKSDNVVAINMKIPKAWIEMADKYAAEVTGPARATRTDILRAALGRGLEDFPSSRPSAAKKRKPKK